MLAGSARSPTSGSDSAGGIRGLWLELELGFGAAVEGVDGLGGSSWAARVVSSLAFNCWKRAVPMPVMSTTLPTLLGSVTRTRSSVTGLPDEAIFSCEAFEATDTGSCARGAGFRSRP